MRGADSRSKDKKLIYFNIRQAKAREKEAQF